MKKIRLKKVKRNETKKKSNGKVRNRQKVAGWKLGL
jgi:hypothetical protein